MGCQFELKLFQVSYHVPLLASKIWKSFKTHQLHEGSTKSGLSTWLYNRTRCSLLQKTSTCITFRTLVATCFS